MGCARATVPRVVVVDEDHSVLDDSWLEVGETGHGRLVPVAVEAKQRDVSPVELGSDPPDGVLEPSLDEPELVLGEAKPVEAVLHLLERRAAVVVVARRVDVPLPALCEGSVAFADRRKAFEAVEQPYR